MSVENNALAQPEPSQRRKTLIQAAIGAVCGGVGMFASMWFLDGRGFPVERLDYVGAILMALVMLLMSLFVGFGALFPSIGARIMSVEDERELRDGRRDLLLGAAFFILCALGLVGLALYSGPEGGLLDRSTASALAIASLAGQLLLFFVPAKINDELNTLVGKEALAFVGQGATLIFGLWAVLTHLGYAELFTPLTLVTGLNALFLLGLFVSLGRRGALT